MYFLNYNPLGNEGNGDWTGVLIVVVICYFVYRWLSGKDEDH